MTEEHLQDLSETYGLRPQKITLVSGGWLNKKWKINTPAGVFIVKQYSRERFSERQIAQIDDALARQMILCEKGIPCPRILPAAGRAIRYADGLLPYMVMDFAEGYAVTPASVTQSQLYSLGEAAARMHRAFAHLPTAGIRRYPENGADLMERLTTNYSTRRAELSTDSHEAYRQAIASQEAILRALSAEYIDSLPRAIAHEDFTPDNMLFTDCALSAILDFDRNQYSYPLHDVGRTLLSLALHNGELRRDYIDAFRRGYAAHLPLSADDLADALRITWCIETFWWIREDFFTGGNEKVCRFRDEILWIGAHFSELRALVE